jgi:dolichol-phosphate mannosyltransferase
MKSIFSVVLPVYNEAENVNDLYQRIKKCFEGFEPHEIVFVNDHSRDDTLEKITDLAEHDPCVKIINFSRNFGHQAAITAGIDFACGDAVVIMDSDLQDTPETIPEMINKWREGYEVVYARRRARKDSFFKKITAFAFYRLLRMIANIDIPEDTGDFRLIDRKVVLEMRRLREHSRFMRGLTSWVGFKQTAVLFDRDDRRHGQTNYPLHKMLKFAGDAFVSFSTVPLKLASLLGFITALVSVVGICYSLIRKVFFADAVVSGWTFTIITIFFIGGIQLLVLGVLGEYIGRIYVETQKRPLYIVRDTINID